MRQIKHEKKEIRTNIYEFMSKDAGRIGLAIILTGMIGSVSFGIILDKTHKFK